MKPLEELLGAESLQALDRDTAQARGLPGAAYQAGFYALEQAALFPAQWCAIGYASDLPEPGDIVPVDLAGSPVILVRGQDANIAAFHNVCRHRGMKLIDAPCRRLDSMVCPWHAWRYALDGTLLNTPRIGGEDSHTQDGFDRSALGLVPIRVARWQDLVFVNLDGKAADFSEHIRPLEQLLSPYDLRDLQPTDPWSLEYPGNWKISVEGAIEDYHIPVGHPQIVQAVRANHPRLDYADGCFYSNSTGREYHDQDRATIMAGAHEDDDGPRKIPYDGSDTRRRTYFMSLFPTGMFQMHGDNAVQGLFLPDGPERTRLVFKHYYMAEHAVDPAYRAHRRSVMQAWQEVFAQDIPFVRAVAETYKMRDRAGIDTRFSPFWESNVHRFQQAVIGALRRAER